MSNRRKATPTELEFITAARGGDRDRLHDALVEMQRDPKRWFCSFAAMIKERPDALAMTRTLQSDSYRMDHGLHGEEPAAGGVSIERERACRMIDVLRRERVRLVPARSRISTQNFARHQARRATGGAASQIRAGRQPQDRQGARARTDADVHRARRRGDRIVAFCCGAWIAIWVDFFRSSGRAVRGKYGVLPVGCAEIPRVW